MNNEARDLDPNDEYDESTLGRSGDDPDDRDREYRLLRAAETLLALHRATGRLTSTSLVDLEWAVRAYDPSDDPPVVERARVQRRRPSVPGARR